MTLVVTRRCALPLAIVLAVSALALSASPGAARLRCEYKGVWTKYQYCWEDGTDPAPARTESDWEGVSDGVATARQSNDVAARNLAEFQAVVNDLSDRLRGLLNSELAPADHESLSSALSAVTRRYVQTVSENARLSQQITTLERRIEALRAELRRLADDENAMIGDIMAIRGTIATLETQIAEHKRQLAAVERVQQHARDFADEMAESARAAQDNFWAAFEAMSADFDLGSPRNYVPRIVPDPVQVERRIVHEDRTLRPAIQPAPVAAPIVVARTPAVTAIAPLSPPITSTQPVEKETFLHALHEWSDALDKTADLQRQTRGLAARAEESAELLRRKQAEIARLTGQRTAIATREEQIRREAAATLLRLQDATAETQRLMMEVLHGFKRFAFWQAAEDGLRVALSGMNEAASTAAYATWLVRTWTRLLHDDLPAAIDILASSSSSEVQEKFQRLTNLEREYTSDLAFAAVGAIGSRRGPEPRRLTKGGFASEADELEDIREVIRLGTQPKQAGSREVRMGEGFLGVWLQRKEGERLIRDPTGQFDYTYAAREKIGRKFLEAVGTDIPPERIEAQFGNIKKQIRDHAGKDGIARLAIFMMPFNRQQREEIQAVVESLPQAQRDKVLFCYGYELQ